MRPEHWLFTIPLRLRSLFRWTRADQELNDELRDHLDRKTEEYVAQGMTRDEAHRRARIDLDGIKQTKEKCRDARRVNWIQDLIQDLHGARRGISLWFARYRPDRFSRGGAPRLASSLARRIPRFFVRGGRAARRSIPGPPASSETMTAAEVGW